MAYRRPRQGYNRVWNQYRGRYTRGSARTRADYYQRFPRASRGIRPAQRGYQRTGGYYGRYNVRGNVGSINVEKKFFDTTIAGLIDTTGESLASLNLVPQGVTQSTRVGRKMTITNINIKGSIAWGQILFNVVAATEIRIVLVLDKQANGANAAFNDVFESTAGISANRHRNLSNSERFVVLKNWQMTPQNLVATTSDNWATQGNTIYRAQASRFKFNKTCKIPIEYSSTTGAITEIRSNNIQLFAVAESADDIATASISCRIRFTDL